MAWIVYLFLITNIILTFGEPIDDGTDVGTIQINKYGRRTVLNPGNFPYIVHLHIETEALKNNPQKLVEQGFCGGTLITRKVVLSAAHCVKEENKKIKITAWLGVLETDLEQGEGQKIPIRGFTIHDNYIRSANLLQNLNDIALLWLFRPATLDAKTVRLAKLPTENFVAAGNYGYIVGWGRRSCGRRTTMLQKAVVKAISPPECQKYFHRLLVPSIFICTISENKKKTTTHGDSGGPLIMDDTVVGVISFGAIDKERTVQQNGLVACDAKKPAVYAYVPKYLKWIYENLNEGPETVLMKPPPVPKRTSSLQQNVPTRRSRI